MLSDLLTILKNTWINGSGVFEPQRQLEGHEQVLIPGDPEREMQTERLQRGIPLLKAVVEDLDYLAQRFKIEL